MFDPATVRRVGEEYKGVLDTLSSVEAHLTERFADFKQVVRALILAVASGESLLLVGSPGTGKSRVIRAFCEIAGVLDLDDEGQAQRDYFEYLLTPFTVPEELFGYFDMTAFREGKPLVRLEENMLQNAQVVYLDEVFNGSSAILNSLLAIMNERVFHDRGKRRPVKNIKYVFAATNQVPERAELRAIFDRFVLRCFVDDINKRGGNSNKLVGELLAKGWQETYGTIKPLANTENLLRDVTKFQAGLKTVQLVDDKSKPYLLDNPTVSKIHSHVSKLRELQISTLSNRRMVKLARLILVNHLYRNRNNARALGTIDDPDISSLLPFMVDSYNETLYNEAARNEATP